MAELLIQPLAAGDPQLLGRYQLIGLLGHGGMGRVYLAVSPAGGQVAVKVMHPQFAGDTAFRERFKREAEVAQLVSGPFTARVLESGVNERTPWLATEYIPGPTLAQLVTEHGPLPDTSVRALAAGLAQALSDIHSRRIVHRDLKPANVILSVTGPRVIDFGIARPLDSASLTATDQLLGTFSYMSPEQLAGQQVTGQSDVYALGAVMIYAATGKTPQQSLLDGDAGTSPRSGPGLGDVPPGLRALVARCMRPDPAQRATLADVIGECGPAGPPRLNDWLPQPAAAFVHTRALQQQGNVTTLLNSRRKAPARPARSAARPAPSPAAAPAARSRQPLRHRYRALSARLSVASRHWPLVRQPSLRRWSRLALLLSLAAVAEVASRTALAERRGPLPLRGLGRAQDLQATIQQFTSWLPDPLNSWARSAGSAAGMDNRLAVTAVALVMLTAIARRTHRNHAHQIAIKTVAAYAASLLVLLVALRLVQTGFGPLIHVAEFLRLWTLAAVALAAAVIYPLAGRAR